MSNVEPPFRITRLDCRSRGHNRARPSGSSVGTFGPALFGSGTQVSALRTGSANPSIRCQSLIFASAGALMIMPTRARRCQWTITRVA